MTRGYTRYTPKRMNKIQAKYRRVASRGLYTPKQMKKIWAMVLRYFACEDPVRSQAMFDQLHAKVDCGSPTRFTNQVRRALGLPEQEIR